MHVVNPEGQTHKSTEGPVEVQINNSIGFKCLYTNVDTITNKMDELSAKISLIDPDIIGLTEIKPKNASWDLTSQEVNITGYTSFINLSGRGSVLFVKNCYGAVEYKPKVMVGSDDIVWCTIKVAGTETLVVGVGYRSPNSTDLQNTLIESSIKSVVDCNFRYVLLMGDFNFPEINWISESANVPDNHPAQRFLTCIQDLFLYQHIHEPTHYRHNQNANVLDLVFTNGEELLNSLQYTEPLGKSHHVTLSWTLTCYQHRTHAKTIKYNYDKGDYAEMQKFFSEFDWKEKLGDLSVEDMWQVIKESFNEAVKRFVPSISVNGKSFSQRKKPPWLDEHVRSVLRGKKKAYASYLKSRDGKHYRDYVKQRNMAKSELRKALRNYEKDIAKKAKKDPKAFYRYVNGKIKGRGVVPDITSSDGTVITENLNKADAFNQFFSSVFTKENSANIPLMSDKLVNQPVVDISFTYDDVLKLLLNLKSDKSPGPDSIHPRVLKECAYVLAYPLFILYRKSMDEGNIPSDWKSGHITPVHKKGSRADVCNYRPVSLTSVVCKVMEKLVRNVILDHMFDNDLMSDYQHGFLPGRSCTTQLLEVLDKWTEIVDNGGALDVIYLDLAKAFDSVPHKRLLVKLQSYGVRGNLLKWIESFLLGRRQRVMIAGIGSEWVSVLSGVPQGSVLGPVLFICYINDMPNTILSFIYIYADDTKISREVSGTHGYNKLQTDLNQIQTWSDDWQLKFNSTKCKVMHIGHSNVQNKYSMKNCGAEVVLESTSEEKDLGVWIDDKLKFTSHVGHVVAKSNQILGLIKRSFVYRDTEVIKRLFTALVRPHLEYANTVWYPRFKKDVEHIEKVQRRATKLVCSIRDLPYQKRLQVLKLPSLVYRRYRGDMIEVYKFIHGIYTTGHNLLPRAPKSALRGHEYKLMKRHCHSQLRANFFSFRVVNLWNRLPCDVIAAPSVNAFKCRFDKHWTNYHYSLDPEDFLCR